MMASGAIDPALQDALQQLGAKRVEATLLAALVEDGAMGTKQIVQRTGLRQPEVSVGMQILRERGWVEAESVPRQGKGRPMHRYTLVADRGKIRKHYEQQGRASIAAYQEAIDGLQEHL